MRPASNCCGPCPARPARPIRWRRLVLPLLVAVSAALGGCAVAPPPTPAATLLQDHLFPSAPSQVDLASVFALSPAMRQYVDSTLAGIDKAPERRPRLVAALHDQGRLNLDYDDGDTRNAAEAFDKRAGHCLSLVVMTAAFAKHVGLPVRFQQVHVRPNYSRANSLTFASGHVNIVLTGLPRSEGGTGADAEDLTIDFVTPDELRGARLEPISEARVLAMFMNNRAAEHLAAGRPAEAYALVRAAIRQDPAYLGAINTLGVIYLRSGHPAAAEQALHTVLARAPDDVPAVSNLVATLVAADRQAEAAPYRRRLAQLQRHPPFYFLDLGVAALREGELRQARAFFERELRRQPFQHEAHYWAGVADAMLGDEAAAEAHLRRAIEHSGNPALGARYSAKLAALKGRPLQ